MPNGDALNEQLEFMERMKKMSLEERSFEMARLSYTLVTKVEALDSKFNDCISNKGSKKMSATTSGITAAVIIGLVEGIKTLLGRG